MMASPARSGWPGRGAVLVLLGLAALIAVERLHTYHEPLERDITGAAVVGHELLAGRELYSDIWDHKPPAPHVTHAVAQALAGYGPGSIYLLGVVAAVVTLLGVYWAASAGGGGRAAGLWAAAFWAVISADAWLQANQPNTEVFINASLVWAFALLVRAASPSFGYGRYLAVGALFALASLYKTVAVVPAALLAIAHLALPPLGPEGRRGAVRQVALVAAVGVLAWALLIGHFALAGRLTPFSEAVFTYNASYAGNVFVNLLWGLHPALWLPVRFDSISPLAGLAACGAVIGMWRGSRRFWTLLIAFGVGTHVAVSLPGYFYPHYYQLWLPLLAVGAGSAIGVLGQMTSQRLASLPQAIGAGVLGILIVFQLPLYRFPADDWSRMKYGDDIFVAEQELARQIDTFLEPGETFYEWGSETGLYFAAGRRPPSGVFYVYPLGRQPLAASLSARVIRDLEREQPELLVIARWAFPGFQGGHPVLDWLLAHYRPFPDGSEAGPFLLFARRDGALEARLAARPRRAAP
ncbi:MAG: hypothetical protein ACE5JD_00895 [Candidatus Methylomirabilia bacterium]